MRDVRDREREEGNELIDEIVSFKTLRYFNIILYTYFC